MAFYNAMAWGDEEAVTRLLDADPMLLETEHASGHIPLEWAASHGQLGVVRLLVQRGANISPPGRRIRTALHWAVSRNHEEMVVYLLEKGAQASMATSLSTTPIMSACGSGRVGMVRRLLQYLGGQGLDERGDAGKTALHWAADFGHGEVLKLLLFAGADPTIRDNRGRTPRALAEEKRDGADEEARQGRWVKCVAVFEWWEGELERGPLLERARCLHDASTTRRDKPTAPVPAFQARVAAGQALPQVEVVAGQQEEQQAGASGKRGASSEAGGGKQAKGEEEVYAVCGYVVRELNAELFTELMQGFHCKDK